MLEARSTNFRFLMSYGPQLERLAALAERYLRDDPNASLIKLRQFGEVLLQYVAARLGKLPCIGESQDKLLRTLKTEHCLHKDVLDMFHRIRRTGNFAAHKNLNDFKEAARCLRAAYNLAVWFQEAFPVEDKLEVRGFVLPPDPAAITRSLERDVETLRARIEAARSAVIKLRLEKEAEKAAREAADVRASQHESERLLKEQLVAEVEQANIALRDELTRLQARALERPDHLKDAINRASALTTITLDIDPRAADPNFARRYLFDPSKVGCGNSEKESD